MPLSSEVIPGWGFTEFVKVAQNEEFLHPIPVAKSPSNATIFLEQKEFVNFAGIHFLGFQQEPDVLAHFAHAASIYGLVTGGSRMTQGVCQAHRDVEEEFCLLTGKERAMTFASGLLANFGFIHAMSAHFYVNHQCHIDNRDAIFVLDHDCHWSIWKAVERLPLGKQLFTFQHNDPAHLETILASLGANKIVVIFESIYSSDGSVAPMGALLDVCERYHAVSYIDDANGFLVYGPQHRPFANEFAHLKRATFLMVSFAKAIGLEGGAIAGPTDPMIALELLSGTSIYTAAMQPPTASTASLIMRKIQEDPTRVDTYLERVALFRRRLLEIGCTLNSVPSYITSILLGSDEHVKLIRRTFREQGYIVPIFHYPAAKPRQVILRIMLNYCHTAEHINGFVEVLSLLKKQYGL